VKRQSNKKVKVVRSERVVEYYEKYDENEQQVGQFAKFR